MSRSVQATDEGIGRLQEARSMQRDVDGRPLSYEGLAEKAGLSDRTVKRFFSKGGKVDVASAIAIIKALKLNRVDILLDKDSLVSEAIESIEAQSPKGSDRANRLVENIENEFRELKVAESLSLKAMEWLESNRGGLSKEAAKSVLPEASSEEISQFSAEIREYLLLIYYCLEIGTWDFMTEAMQQAPPSITKEAQLYADALAFIKNQRVSRELPPSEAEEILLCLNYLINTLPVMY